jgi:octaprenyl-diphosphate synthase
VCDALDGFGRSLGIAFQIADDLLDMTGSEQKTGKSLGTDLQKQKLTLPLIHLLSTSAPRRAAEIRELLAHPNDQTRAALLPMLKNSGALQYARSRADEFTVAARQHLAALPESPARQLLEDMADFVTVRSA